MFWDIFSGVCVIIIASLTLLYLKKRSQKKKRDKKVLDQLNQSIETILHNQKHQNVSIEEIKKELQLTRVDSQCSIHALEMASNGNKFKENILIKRKQLMAELNFTYKD